MTEEIVSKHLGGQVYVNNINFIYENIAYKGAEFIIELNLDSTL